MSKREPARILMRVTSNGLVPRDELGIDELYRYPVGEDIEVSIYREPSPPLRRLYFAVLDELYPSTEFPTQDALADRIKLRLGHIDGYETLAGGVKVKTASLSILDHDELEQFVEAAWKLIVTEIKPGVDLAPIIDSKRRKQERRRR